MKEEKLRILFKEVGKKPKVMEIEDTLEAKQNLVGGLIEVVSYKDDMVLICNEEGKVYNMPENLRFPNDSIMGNCFVVGDDWENAGFKSLNVEQIRQARMDLNSKAVIYPDIDYLDKSFEELEAEGMEAD